MEVFSVSLLKQIPETPEGQTRKEVIEIRDYDSADKALTLFAQHIAAYCHPHRYEGATVYISIHSNQEHFKIPPELIRLAHKNKWNIEIDFND